MGSRVGKQIPRENRCKLAREAVGFAEKDDVGNLLRPLDAGGHRSAVAVGSRRHDSDLYPQLVDRLSEWLDRVAFQNEFLTLMYRMGRTRPLALPAHPVQSCSSMLTPSFRQSPRTNAATLLLTKGSCYTYTIK